jgi:hypothetical protein
VPNNPPSLESLSGIIRRLEDQVAQLAARTPRPEAQQSLYDVTRRSGAACKVRRSTTQSIPNTALTAISWGAADSDPFGMWDIATPTRLVAPWDGYYGLSTTVTWAEITVALSWRKCGVFLNGSTTVFEEFDIDMITASQTHQPTNHLASLGFPLAAGEFAEVKVEQNSGAARTTSAEAFGIPFVFAKLVYFGAGPII